jgi:hypothetical protein
MQYEVGIPWDHDIYYPGQITSLWLEVLRRLLETLSLQPLGVAKVDCFCGVDAKKI